MSEYIIDNDTVYLYFDDKPNKDIRDYLKLYKWHWNSEDECWEHKNEMTTTLTADMALLFYDLSLKNANIDINQIIEELKQERQNN